MGGKDGGNVTLWSNHKDLVKKGIKVFLVIQ